MKNFKKKILILQSCFLKSDNIFNLFCCSSKTFHLNFIKKIHNFVKSIHGALKNSKIKYKLPKQ